MEQENINFWDNVKELLDIQDVTQKELAAKTGINLGTLKNQICRNVIPDAIEAVKIASALGVTVETLCNGKTEMMPMKNDKINYAHLINSVDMTNPKDVVDKIKGFLAHRELDPEQILFGLGLILDKNKEAYITSLKQDLVEMKHQLNEVVNENNKLRERLNKAEARKAQFPLKKRVIVIKNKKDGE